MSGSQTRDALGGLAVHALPFAARGAEIDLRPLASRRLAQLLGRGHVDRAAGERDAIDLARPLGRHQARGDIGRHRSGSRVNGSP